MDCIIVDDDNAARLIIKQLCKTTSKLVVADEFSSAIDAIKYLNEKTVDVVFLDIHMPSFSGFDFLRTIKSSAKIILTTSDKNFALEAFEYTNVVDYLVKPVSKQRFETSLKKLDAFSEKDTVTEIVADAKVPSSDFIYVNVDRRLVKINIPDILYIEAKGDYIAIKTAGKSFIVHSTLKKVQDKLPEEFFMKIHRSFIINFSKIIDIEDNSVLIEKSVIPISRANKSELIKRLNLL
jgi:DNA-binding LytR/AlgR family response regulator